MAPELGVSGVVDRKNLSMGARILWAPSLYFILLLADAAYESQRPTCSGYENGDES